MRDYLERIRDLHVKIQLKQAKVDDLWSSVTYPGVSYDIRVQSTRNYNKHTDDICRITELEKEIKKLIAERNRMIKKLDKPLEQLEPNEAKVIKLRYFKYNTWEQTASKINCTKRWAYELHKMAIKKLTKYFDFTSIL